MTSIILNDAMGAMNDEMILLIIALLLISNIIFIVLYLRVKKKLKSPEKDKTELYAFMQDLMNGHGLVKVTRIDTSDIFLRSPRAR